MAACNLPQRRTAPHDPLSYPSRLNAAAQSLTHSSRDRQSCPAAARSVIKPATAWSSAVAGTRGSGAHVSRSTGGTLTATRGLLLAHPGKHAVNSSAVIA